LAPQETRRFIITLQINWSLQDKSEEDFVRELTSSQPFIPAYFGFDVALNKKKEPRILINQYNLLKSLEMQRS
jgi:hypothetical protein